MMYPSGKAPPASFDLRRRSVRRGFLAGRECPNQNPKPFAPRAFPATVSEVWTTDSDARAWRPSVHWRKGHLAGRTQPAEPMFPPSGPESQSAASVPAGCVFVCWRARKSDNSMQAIFLPVKLDGPGACLRRAAHDGRHTHHCHSAASDCQSRNWCSKRRPRARC